MMLIYNMTRDWSRIPNLESRVRAYRNRQLIRSEQILTERGICYVGNNFLASNLSAKLFFICHEISTSICDTISTKSTLFSFRYLLTGVQPEPTVVDTFFENREAIEVLASNLFDGDMGYIMVGFSGSITVSDSSLKGGKENLNYSILFLKIHIHSPYETINIGKVSYYTDYAIEYHCFSNEVIADMNFQK